MFQHSRLSAFQIRTRGKVHSRISPNENFISTLQRFDECWHRCGTGSSRKPHRDSKSLSPHLVFLSAAHHDVLRHARHDNSCCSQGRPCGTSHHLRILFFSVNGGLIHQRRPCRFPSQVIAGDGQVTLGQSVVMKPNAKKVRRLANGVISGFAGTDPHGTLFSVLVFCNN